MYRTEDRELVLKGRPREHAWGLWLLLSVGGAGERARLQSGGPRAALSLPSRLRLFQICNPHVNPGANF